MKTTWRCLFTGFLFAAATSQALGATAKTTAAAPKAATAETAATGSTEESPATVTLPPQADVLLFDGTGATAGDVTDWEGVLTSMGKTYATATSAQMNAMTETLLKSYKLILWGGGDSITMGNSLNKTATALVNKVVMQDGVPYLGVCAGAFMGADSNLTNTFNLTSGIYYNFYAEGKDEMVKISTSSSGGYDIAYENGPDLQGYNEATGAKENFGTVVAEYPGATPAIVQQSVGTGGFVVLSGVHPEASTDWGLGETTDEHTADVAYAEALVDAAYNKKALPAY